MGTTHSHSFSLNISIKFLVLKLLSISFIIFLSMACGSGSSPKESNDSEATSSNDETFTPSQREEIIINGKSIPTKSNSMYIFYRPEAKEELLNKVSSNLINILDHPSLGAIQIYLNTKEDLSFINNLSNNDKFYVWPDISNSSTLTREKGPVQLPFGFRYPKNFTLAHNLIQNKDFDYRFLIIESQQSGYPEICPDKYKLIKLDEDLYSSNHATLIAHLIAENTRSKILPTIYADIVHGTSYWPHHLDAINMSFGAQNDNLTDSLLVGYYIRAWLNDVALCKSRGGPVHENDSSNLYSLSGPSIGGTKLEYNNRLSLSTVIRVGICIDNEDGTYTRDSRHLHHVDIFYPLNSTITSSSFHTAIVTGLVSKVNRIYELYSGKAASEVVRSNSKIATDEFGSFRVLDYYNSLISSIKYPFAYQTEQYKHEVNLEIHNPLWTAHIDKPIFLHVYQNAKSNENLIATHTFNRPHGKSQFTFEVVTTNTDKIYLELDNHGILSGLTPLDIIHDTPNPEPIPDPEESYRTFDSGLLKFKGKYERKMLLTEPAVKDLSAGSFSFSYVGFDESPPKAHYANFEYNNIDLGEGIDKHIDDEFELYPDKNNAKGAIFSEYLVPSGRSSIFFGEIDNSSNHILSHNTFHIIKQRPIADNYIIPEDSSFKMELIEGFGDAEELNSHIRVSERKINFMNLGSLESGTYFFMVLVYVENSTAYGDTFFHEMSIVVE